MKFLPHLLLILVLSFWAGNSAAQDNAGSTQNSAQTEQNSEGAQSTEEELAELQGARDADDPLYPFWDDAADDAETLIDSAENYTVDQLDKLREQLVKFRNEFADARSANSERIGTLRAQITALGPEPENGIEADEITARRIGLQEQLEELLAPVRVADSAFRRADGLIGEIDSILRERQARKLLALSPSPLDPRNWWIAFNDSGRIFRDLLEDAAYLFDAHRQSQFREQLPLILFLTAVSIALIVKGRGWALVLIDHLRKFGGRGSGVWTFLVSLFRIIIPLSGVYGLAHTLQLSGLFGPRVESLIQLLPLWGLILLGFRWLAERLYARDDEEAIIQISSQRRKQARFYMLALSILFVLRSIVAVLFDFEKALPETVSVFAFPIVVLVGAVLILMGLNLRHRPVPAPEVAPDSDSPEATTTGFSRTLRIAGTVMVTIGAVAPVMASIGYAEAGNALLYPTILSLVILGFVVVFQRFGADVYGLLTGRGAEARDGLFAIFIGFVLLTLSLPLLALVWGARVTDLTEIWVRFTEGFDIGGVRISPTDFLVFAAVFVVGYFATRLLQATLKQTVLPKTSLDIGGQNAIVSGVGYVGIFLAAMIAISVAGLDLSGIAIVAGALSVGIGFGLQTIVSNFVSGIILLVERPISEGDWIEVGGQMGYVKDISVRSTRIQTFDRTDVIVPNSDLISGTVTNYTHGNTVGRLIVAVGVAYGTDTKKVDKILREIANAHPMILGNPPPNIVLMGFGADSLDFEIRAILRDVNWILNVRNDINHEIVRRFAEEGVEIPFAQRDVWLRNPETLHQRVQEASTENNEESVPDLSDNRS